MRKLLLLFCLIIPGVTMAEGSLDQSICIRTIDGCTRLISKGSKLPVSYSETFSNSKDEQEMVEIGLYQGESAKIEENSLIGTFDLPISKLPATEASLQVTLVVDKQKRLTIKTYDQNSKQNHSIEAGVVK
jgi:molecular chaperone DnaK (HSP70)